jgi:uncharacterized membrane protein YesL
MGEKGDLGSSLITKITYYIYWFLAANFYFSVCNLPLILISATTYMQGKGYQNQISILLLISIIPSGPALTALLNVMGKLVREKDINVTRDYFTAYRKNFLESLFWSGGLLAVLSIVYIDTLFIRSKAGLYFVQIVLLFLGLLIISLAFYIFPIISRFYFNIGNVIKLSFLYCIKKIHITIFNWICLIVLLILVLKVSAFFLLFIWSILGYAIMLNERNMLKEIEDKFTN